MGKRWGARRKAASVMRAFKQGALRGTSGTTVKSHASAVAIAAAEYAHNKKRRRY